MFVCRSLAKLSPLGDVRKGLFALQGRFAKSSPDGQSTHQKEFQPCLVTTFGMFPMVHALRGSCFSQHMLTGLPATDSEEVLQSGQAQVGPTHPLQHNNVVQGQEVKVQLLEQQCRQLRAQNQRLYDELSTASQDRRWLRELNHRLSIEICKTRKDCEQLDAKQLANTCNVQHQEAQTIFPDWRDCKRTDKDIQTVVSNLHNFGQGIGSQTCKRRHQGTQTAVDASENETQKVTYALQNGTTAETNPSLVDGLPGNASELNICHCGNFWGCAKHRVYSGALMLAHRELAFSIASGPPGLQVEPPPGLQVEPTSTEADCARLKLVTRTVPQRQKWQQNKLRGRRQFLQHKACPDPDCKASR